MMGVDERRFGLRQYQALITEWNDRQPKPDGSKPSRGPTSDRLKAAMAAHMTTQ